MKFFNWAIFIPFALSLHSANAEVIWAHGVSEAGGWYDVDKYLKYDGYTRYSPGSEVSSFCWAGAAANILTYWQQHYAKNLPAGVPKSDLSKGTTASRDLFEVFSQNWSNKGGAADRGIDWFLTGYDRRKPNITDNLATTTETFPLEALIKHDLTEFDNIEKFNFDPNKTYSTGGFLNPTNQPSGYSTRYKLITGPVTGKESENLGVVSLSKDDVMPLIRDSLQNYGCFGLDIGGHALTCWGADFDDTTGLAKSIWITDTDDCFTGLQKIDLSYFLTVNNKDVVITDGTTLPEGNIYISDIKLMTYKAYKMTEEGVPLLDDSGNPIIDTSKTDDLNKPDTEYSINKTIRVQSINIFTMPTLPIPEPTSVASLLLGFGLFAGARRRKE